MSRRSGERVTIPSDPNPEANGVDLEAVALGEQETAGDDNSGDSGDGGDGDGTAANQDSLAGGSPIDDNDDRIIRDEAGNPTYSPTGRLRKRRTRTSSGSTQQARRPAGQKVPVASLTRFLMFAHLTMANMTITPELQVNEDEAKMLAEPLSELLILYDVKIDPKVMAAMELAGAASYVYGPRIYMIRERLKAEKAARDAKRAEAQHRTIGPSTVAEPVFAPSPLVNGNGPIGPIQ